MNFVKSYDYYKMYNKADYTFAVIKEIGEELNICIKGETYSDMIDYEFAEYNYKLKTKQQDKKLV